MGLDMYLTRKIYIGAEYEHRNIDGVIFITQDGKKLDIDFKKISYVEEMAGYWRKANHIHQWFVENVQEGTDDCGDYSVEQSSIKELKEACEKVLKDPSKAPELLPTAEGFFFGGTDYDEWYIESLKETIEILLPLEDCKGELYYHSSWQPHTEPLTNYSRSGVTYDHLLEAIARRHGYEQEES